MSRASVRPPTASGFSSERRSAPSISPTLRRISSSGNAGVSSTSASRSSPRSRSFFRTARLTVVPSRPASASSPPPTNSMARSSSGPVRLAVPRVSSSAVRLAKPGASGGSKAEPARRYTRSATMGIAGRGATSSRMPLASTSRWASGAASGGAESGTASSSVTSGRRRRIGVLSIELLSELEHGQAEDYGTEGDQGQEARPEVLEAHALEDDAAHDLEKVGERDDGGQVLGGRRHALDGEQEARQIDGGQEGQEGELHGLGHRPRSGGHEDADAERAHHEDEGQRVEQEEAPADRHVEHEMRHQQRHGHLPVGDEQVRDDLPQQELPAPDRAHDQGLQRALLPLAHHRHGHGGDGGLHEEGTDEPRNDEDGRQQVGIVPGADAHVEWRGKVARDWSALRALGED